MNASSISNTTSTSFDNVIYVRFPAHRPANVPPAAGEARPVVRRRPPPELIESDDTLVERIVIGDGVSRGELHSRYAELAYGAASAILEDLADVEHVVVCAFEDASTGWPPERGHVKGWLLRLVRRAARARRRVLEGLDD